MGPEQRKQLRDRQQFDSPEEWHERRGRKGRPSHEERRADRRRMMDELRELSPEERERALQRMEDFRKLPPEARDRIVKRLRGFENLPEGERDRIRKNAERCAICRRKTVSGCAPRWIVSTGWSRKRDSACSTGCWRKTPALEGPAGRPAPAAYFSAAGPPRDSIQRERLALPPLK